MKLQQYEIDVSTISKKEFLKFILLLKSKEENVYIAKHTKNTGHLWYSELSGGWKQWGNNDPVDNLISIDEAIKLLTPSKIKFTV